MQKLIPSSNNKTERKVDTKFQDLHTRVATKLEYLDAKVDTKFQNLEQQVGNLDTKVSDLKTTMETNVVRDTDLLLLNGFSSHEFTLIEFTKQQTKPSHGHRGGGAFTAQGWSFTFNVFTASGTHLTANINKQHEYAKIEGVAILHMLNQLGDHGHHIGTETRLLKATTTFLGDSIEFFPLNRLDYCVDTNTQYLKDDCLKFRLFMKVKAC